jgi:hypothetical protein
MKTYEAKVEILECGTKAKTLNPYTHPYWNDEYEYDGGYDAHARDVQQWQQAESQRLTLVVEIDPFSSFIALPGMIKLALINEHELTCRIL